MNGAACRSSIAPPSAAKPSATMNLRPGPQAAIAKSSRTRNEKSVRRFVADQGEAQRLRRRMKGEEEDTPKDDPKSQFYCPSEMGGGPVCFHLRFRSKHDWKRASGFGRYREKETRLQRHCSANLNRQARQVRANLFERAFCWVSHVVDAVAVVFWHAESQTARAIAAGRDLPQRSGLQGRQRLFRLAVERCAPANTKCPR